MTTIYRALLSKCIPGEMVQNVADCTECLRGFPQETYPTGMDGIAPQFLAVTGVLSRDGPFLICVSYQISVYDHSRCKSKYL